MHATIHELLPQRHRFEKVEERYAVQDTRTLRLWAQLQAWKVLKVAVIGEALRGFRGVVRGGAPSSANVVLFEKRSNSFKVKISGGGRCGVTHHCFSPSALSKHYPRGASV